MKLIECQLYLLIYNKHRLLYSKEFNAHEFNYLYQMDKYLKWYRLSKITQEKEIT